MSGVRYQAQTKSDPFKKRRLRRNPAFKLWPGQAWKEICGAALVGIDYGPIMKRWNLMLYGKA